jgi:hypothetical protein
MLMRLKAAVCELVREKLEAPIQSVFVGYLQGQKMLLWDAPGADDKNSRNLSSWEHSFQN